MTKGKLTRQELGWLLTQEAQGAAERLRRGVTALTQAPPSPGVDLSGMDASLSALDDTMRMLNNLHARPSSAHGRRGRIDLASLLWEVAPEARVSIEPGSGTEVAVDEAELRRMLHVMLGHGSGSGSVVTVRREGDEVVTGVVLGADSSVTAETERAWLARMALRYGGRYELVGGQEVLALPAQGVDQRDDLAQLRKELDEARRQGEAYARELAAAWAAGEEVPGLSSQPPPATPGAARHAAIARFAGGVAATLRGILSPVARELAELRGASASATRKSAPEFDVGTRPEVPPQGRQPEGRTRPEADERVEAVRRGLLAAQDFVAELAAVGESDPNEPVREVDLVEAVRAELRALEARAARAGVVVRVTAAPHEGARTIARVAPRAAGVLLRSLVAHAIAATPRGAAVLVTVVAPAEGDGPGARVRVDDAGTLVPTSARRALQGLEVDPGTFGRPSGVALFVASEIAAAQGAALDVEDAPAQDGGGGVRVTVTFSR